MSEQEPGGREYYLNHLSRLFAEDKTQRARTMPVERLLDSAADLGIRVLAGEAGLQRPLNSIKIQKPGLALSGYLETLRDGTVQILGRGEIRFMKEMEAPDLTRRLNQLFEHGVACLLITRDQSPPEILASRCDALRIPLLTTPKKGGDLVEKLIPLLEQNLCPRIKFHSDMVVVYGLGILVLGRSGVGKSECALDLVMRGHQLVADDMVTVWRSSSGRLFGFGDELTRNHMEIRGLGIIDIKNLFSITAVADSHSVDLAIYLEHMDPHEMIPRLGLESEALSIIGVKIPLIRLPVAPGRNLANLIEVAARNHLLIRKGQHAAKNLAEKLDRLLEARSDQLEK